MRRHDPYSFFQRHREADRIEEFLTKNTSVFGRVLVKGAGEVVVTVDFPIWFIERPNFSFGGELAEGDFIKEKSFPTVSGVIEEWVMKKEQRLGGGYFTGAKIIVVTTGKIDQNVWLHWRFEGKALSNPTILEDQ